MLVDFKNTFFEKLQKISFFFWQKANLLRWQIFIFLRLSLLQLQK